MIFAGIDVNIITHEKALAAGVEAFGLWVWGMCWTQLHETDGRLPRAVVMSAMGEQRRVLRRLAVRLVTSGLWAELKCGSCRVCLESESRPSQVQVASESGPDRVGIESESRSSTVAIESACGSFQVRNYTRKNQTADEIQAKKAASAERVRRWRDRRNAVTPSVTEHVRTDPPPEPPPEPPPDNTTRHQGGESAPPDVTLRGARVLKADEPLTDQRRNDFEAQTANLPARDIAPEWQAFVDHRIAASKLFASGAAVDADWRRWVTRQNVMEAKERIKAQNDHGRGGAKRGAEITKQPFDESAPWMTLEGTGS